MTEELIDLGRRWAAWKGFRWESGMLACFEYEGKTATLRVVNHIGPSPHECLYEGESSINCIEGEWFYDGEPIGSPIPSTSDPATIGHLQARVQAAYPRGLIVSSLPYLKTWSVETEHQEWESKSGIAGPLVCALEAAP